MVQNVDALQALVGEAGGSVLALPVVQAGRQIGGHAHAARDDQRIVDEQSFGVGEGLVTGVDVVGDLLGGFDGGHVLHDGVSGLAGDEAILHAGAQIGIAHTAGAFGLIERVRFGLGVGVVCAPVAEQELELAVAADRRQEAVGGAFGDDDVDEVCTVIQDALQLLLEHLALFVPVGGRRVVGQLDLDGEGDALCAQLFHGGIAALLGLGFVEELGDVGQIAALGVVHTIGGRAEVRGRDGVQLVAVVAFGGGDGQRDGVVDAVQEALAEVGVVDGLGPVVRLILGVHALDAPVGELVGEGHEVEHVEVSIVGVGTVHGDHALGGVVAQPAVEDVGADGGFVDLAALDHLGAVDGGFGVVDAADRLDVHAVGVVVLGILLHDPRFQRLVLGQIECAAAVHGLGAGGVLVAHLVQQGAVGRLIGQIAQQAQEAGEVVGQGVGQGVVIHGLDAHSVEVHGGIGAGRAVGCGDGDDAAAVYGVGGPVVIHDAGVGVVQVDVVVVVVVRAGNVGGDQTDVGRSIVRGQDVLQGVHKVLCGDGGNDFAVVVHPVLIPQLEGPGQGVGIPVPLGGQTFAHDALVVVLDQRIHAVRAHDHFQIGGGGQIVQGGGLAGIQNGVLGGIDRAGSRTTGAAGRRTAAAAQQTGGTGGSGCQTAGLEELAARNRMFHDKIPLSSCFVFWTPAAGHAVSHQRGRCEKRRNGNTSVTPL